MAERAWNAILPRPRKVAVRTRYGEEDLVVRPILPARRLYASAEPHKFGNPGKPPKDSRGKRMLRQGMLLPEGAILFPRNDYDLVGRRTLRHDILVGGIYDALRARVHTALNYGVRGENGETQNLTILRSSVSEICALLAEYGRMDEEERRKLRAATLHSAGKLARSEKPTKRDAYGKLVGSLDVRDRLGRINPGATRARVIAAWGKLGMRLAEIRSITSALGYYEWALINERDRILAILGELERVLTLFVGESGLLRREPEKAARSAKGMAERLRIAAHELESIFVEPFIFSRDILLTELRGAADLLWAKGPTLTVLELLDRALRAVRFRFVQNDLEKIRMEYSSAVLFYAKKAEERRGDFASRIMDFAVYVGRVLNDNDFRIRPKERIITELECAARLVDADQHDPAKDALRRASDLFSRPEPVS